ncbi:hypothetical protein CEXT_516851 [Caerostris extrusa]|uniref:Uncharacterized protein n=1 Tax=Caerostris extrusa TaxID=172846 RepID=A0AAV4MT70_CAEEX|nr:hypothetical protein CEXT_516851 [Caerostris extrusa]
MAGTRLLPKPIKMVRWQGNLRHQQIPKRHRTVSNKQLRFHGKQNQQQQQQQQHGEITAINKFRNDIEHFRTSTPVSWNTNSTTTTATWGVGSENLVEGCGGVVRTVNERHGELSRRFTSTPREVMACFPVTKSGEAAPENPEFESHCAGTPLAAMRPKLAPRSKLSSFFRAFLIQ